MASLNDGDEDSADDEDEGDEDSMEKSGGSTDDKEGVHRMALKQITKLLTSLFSWRGQTR